MMSHPPKSRSPFTSPVSLALLYIRRRPSSSWKEQPVTMGDEDTTLHVIFFPFMAAGHVIPMVDMAKLFARRGVRATFFTTTANAPPVQHAVERFNNSGEGFVPISLEVIPFPASAAGLPDGCENASSLPDRSPETRARFFRATAMLREDFAGALKFLRPDAVVSDFFLPWTLEVASEVGVPRLVFYGTGFFSMCAGHAVDELRKLGSVGSISDDGSNKSTVVLPGLPHRVEMLMAHVPDLAKANPGFAKVFAEMKSSAAASHGVVVNTFYELEPQYADHYRTALGRRAWHVGPTSLFIHEDPSAAAAISGGGGGNEADLREWLDARHVDNGGRRSVLYACFGSLVSFSHAQTKEIALGLEASGHDFIWVVREKSTWQPPEGFKERIAGRGKIVSGWVPQTMILNHAAVGGFLTHCGWNSVMEGISAGIPMATWPMGADQFFNERLIVDLLGIAVAVGVDEYAKGQETSSSVVAEEEVKAAIERLMGHGEEAEKRRVKAAELRRAARVAVDVGGSSFVDLGSLIRELKEARSTSAVAGG